MTLKSAEPNNGAEILHLRWNGTLYMDQKVSLSLVKKDQLCAIAVVNRKLILKVLLKMVAMATSHSLLR